MGLMNCNSCKRPFVKSGNLSLCSQCLRNETQLFESYYQRLLRATKSNTIAKLCHDTDLDRHRLTNALNYRLGLGNVVHLPSLKTGKCYVCRESHSHSGCREPVCLPCLDKLFLSLSKTNPLFQPPTGKPPEQPTSAGQMLESTRAEVEAHQQTIQELKAELERYRFHFGKLPNKNLRVCHGGASTGTHGPTAACGNEILSLTEEDDSLSTDEWQAIEIELGLVGAPRPTARIGFRKQS